jgi:hypothetical protein
LLPLSIYAFLFIYGFVEGGSKNGKNLNKFVKVDIDSLNIDGKWKFWFDGEEEVQAKGIEVQKVLRLSLTFKIKSKDGV